MQILGVLGSPRPKGNTSILLGEALASAREVGAETSVLILQAKDIKPCDGCNTCRETGKCHINDDMSECSNMLLAADGIIFATPVYFYSMTGQMKIFIDRTYALGVPTRKMANKVGGIITVGGREGTMLAAAPFYIYFASYRMLATDWVIGYASAKGAIKKDTYAMKAARELGRQIVLRVKAGFKFPENPPTAMHRLIATQYSVGASPHG